MTTSYQAGWKRSALECCLVGVGISLCSLASAQLPNLGKSKPLPNLNRALPSVNQVVPNPARVLPSTQQVVPNVGNTVNGVTRQVPSATRVVPNVVPNINGTVNGVPRLSGSATGTVAAPTHLFVSPAAGATLGAHVPVRLQLTNAALVGAAANLGLGVDTRNNRLRVAGVGTGTIASAAGLRVGDQILAVNRVWVRSFDQFTLDLATAVSADGQAWLYVDRGGVPQWIDLRFSGIVQPRLGVNMETVQGVVSVTNVIAGSVAASAGLRVGDQILAVNGVRITSDAELIAAVGLAAQADGHLALLIRRDGAEQQVNAMVQTTASVDGGPVVDTGGAVTADIRSRVGALQAEATLLAQSRAAVVRLSAASLQPRIDELKQTVGLVGVDVASAPVLAQAELAAAFRTTQQLNADLLATTKDLSVEARAEFDAMVQVAAALQAELGVSTGTGAAVGAGVNAAATVDGAVPGSVPVVAPPLPPAPLPRIDK